MKINNIKRAFTLIELLVVITIIGILATGATSIYTSQIQKSRDATRITSIKALQSGVEQYYQDTSIYPLGGTAWTDTTVGVAVYNPGLAVDPKHGENCNGTSTCGYIYIVANDSNGITQGTYEISTAFENSGNVTNKATGDGGNDNNRLEIGLADIGTLDTSADSYTMTTTSAGDTIDKIVIIKDDVLEY